jgi:hypothetical protein
MRLLKCRDVAALIGLATMFLPACSKKPAQTTFATPDDAATTLLQALKTDDMEQLRGMFGPDAMQAAASGDSISDRHDREVVALAMEQSWKWAPHGSDRNELIIGDEQWPFPAPLVRTGTVWKFDSEAGKAEVLARRIGRNELSVIDFCRAYVDMQREYASRPHDGKRAGLFAARLRSSAGRHDGLYWPVKLGEMRSPLGDLAAEAAAEGYEVDKPSASPFWGYHFRVLTAQGPDAPGGARNYVVDGEMSGGFALVAYPAKYGSSGVMTFMVNQDGIVYEKDLGKDTVSHGARLSEYNPDKTWASVRMR